MTQITCIIWVYAHISEAYICATEASAPETRRSESVSRHRVYELSTPHYCNTSLKYTTPHYCNVMNETELQTNVEIKTDSVDAEELEMINKLAGTCNGQAFAFMEQSDNDIIIKDALIEGSAIAHCFIHDRDRGVIIDACMGQFDAGGTMGAWDGDSHPYAQEHEEVREWESREEFREFYESATENDFIF